MTPIIEPPQNLLWQNINLPSIRSGRTNNWTEMEEDGLNFNSLNTTYNNSNNQTVLDEFYYDWGIDYTKIFVLR